MAWRSRCSEWDDCLRPRQSFIRPPHPTGSSRTHFDGPRRSYRKDPASWSTSHLLDDCDEMFLLKLSDVPHQGRHYLDCQPLNAVETALATVIVIAGSLAAARTAFLP